jgi:hypothetical protein
MRRARSENGQAHAAPAQIPHQFPQATVPSMALAGPGAADRHRLVDVPRGRFGTSGLAGVNARTSASACARIFLTGVTDRAPVGALRGIG